MTDSTPTAPDPSGKPSREEPSPPPSSPPPDLDERSRAEAAVREVDMDALDSGGHVVICNWNSKGDAIVRELHSPVIEDHRLIVIITDDLDALPVNPTDDAWNGVFTVIGDPTDERTLRRANVAKASAAIILADERHLDWADSKSILIALAIESLNNDVHTIVETREGRNLPHFRRTQVDEVICVDEVAEKLVSQACLTHGLSALYLHLLSATEDTNEVYIVPLPEAAAGRTYQSVREAINAVAEVAYILIGFLIPEDAAPAGHGLATIKRGSGEHRVMVINPPASGNGASLTKDTVLTPDVELIIIAYSRPRLNDGLFLAG